MDIIPLCLYHDINEVNGLYRGFFSMSQNEDCPMKNGDYNLVKKFYVISPNVRPIPYRADLICATKTNVYPYSNIELSKKYDPFNMDKECLTFIAWIETMPNTTPLYIYNKGEILFPSFDNDPPSDEYKELNISPIYVLLAPNETGVRLTGITGIEQSFDMKDGKPLFLFESHHGACVPSPNGVSLKDCMKIQSLTVSQHVEPTLLNELKLLYGNKEKKSWTGVIGWTILGIMLVSLAIVLYYLGT